MGCITNNPIITEKSIPLPPIETINHPPVINVSSNIKFRSASEMKRIIEKHSGLSYYPEDSQYFLPTKENMEVIIPYLDNLFRKMGVHYIADGTDCDDFARLKAELSQLIISQAYEIEASPTIFVIFVVQKYEWASVKSGGAHAVCVYACVDEENGNKVEVYVWEPQSMEIIKITDYPNRDGIFYVGGEKAEVGEEKNENKNK